MHSLLILGSGRSGTSMVTALFRNSGYYFGESLLTPDGSNPFGYYEDEILNSINDEIIDRMVFLRTASRIPGLLHPAHRHDFSHWLSAPLFLIPRKPSAELESKMRRYMDRTPFCYKDPRFSVTLPVWRPYLPAGTRFLVVFREPDRTIDSILRFCEREDKTRLPVTPEWAYLHWARNYGRLLDRLSDGGDWLFVDYDSIVEGRALEAIRSFTGAELDTSEVDPSVRSSNPNGKFGDLPEARRCYEVYRRLRERSDHDLAKWPH